MAPETKGRVSVVKRSVRRSKQSAKASERQHRQALNVAFRAMRNRGLIALQNFACCTNCGVDDICERAGERTMYAFYHGHDEESRLEGENIYIAYGATHEDNDAVAKRAGQIVAQCLRDAGLVVEWSGDIREKVRVKGFEK